MHRVIIDVAAKAEMVELVDYVQRDSPKNARELAQRLARTLERIGRTPRVGHADPDAPGVPAGAAALLITVSGVAIRYLYPFTFEHEPCVLVVSIRRGKRKALDDLAYVLRWLEERARDRR